MGAIIIGIIYLIIGLLVRVYPNILAGYHSLSQKERENSEKNGLSFYAFLLFSMMGAIVLMGYPLSIWLKQPSLSIGILVIVSLVGMVIAVVGGNLLTNNRYR